MYTRKYFKTCAYIVNFQNPYLKLDDYELKNNADEYLRLVIYVMQVQLSLSHVYQSM